MKSKEEILTEIAEQNNRDSWSLSNGMDFFDGNASSVFKAMDEYAKQECFDFLKFVRFKFKNTYNSLWEEIREDFEVPTIYETDDLYNLFLQSKQ